MTKSYKILLCDNIHFHMQILYYLYFYLVVSIHLLPGNIQRIPLVSLLTIVLNGTQIFGKE